MALNFFCSLIYFFSLLIFSSQVYTSIDEYYPKNLKPSSSNYGETGLLEMPSARLMEEGSLKFGISASYPNEYTYISATPFSWFEAVYRYTEQKNLLYGPSSYSGNQSLKDKGFDLKIKVLPESYYLPQISLGIRDIAGTGRFSSEYIVGSKKFGNLDFTLGLGWGALGQDKSFRNPFLSWHKNLEFRGSELGEGGGFNSNDWFSGDRISIFTGMEYSWQRHGLNLKVEYDTSNPDLGFSGPPIPVKSRFNFGLSRPFGELIDVGISYERGSELRFSFALKGNYGKKALVAKYDPPKRVIKLNEEQKKKITNNEDIFYRSVNKSLREESIFIQGASLEEKNVEVIIAQNRFRSFPRAIGRSTRIISALSPEKVEVIKIVVMNGDLEIYSVEISREQFDNFEEGKISITELLMSADIISNQSPEIYKITEFQPSITFPEFFLAMSPSLRHQIGGPEAFYLGQLWWKINSKIKFMRGLTLHTTLGLDIYNNFNEFKNPSYSKIPHVRSDIQDYLAEGENNLARMKLEYMWSPRTDWFARLDIGYLEEMFGGFGGEVYFRPFNSQFSSSLSLHKVKQRAFNQRFDFRDYEVETGHLGLYYNFPKGVSGQLLLGKYLAGDKGGTIDLSRRFKNGFTLGVFATKTDLSSEEFGEGSFDKGFYFSIPTDLFFTKFQQGNIAFGLHPLTKDGGAMLNHLNGLHSLLGDTGASSVNRDWRDIGD